MTSVCLDRQHQNENTKSVFQALIPRDDLQHDSFAHGQQVFHLHARRVSTRFHHQAELLHDARKHQLHLHLRKPQPDAVVGALAEGEVGVRVTRLFRVGAETFRVKLVRVRIKFRIMLHAVDWDEDACILGNLDAFNDSFLHALAAQDYTCKYKEMVFCQKCIRRSVHNHHPESRVKRWIRP